MKCPRGQGGFLCSGKNKEVRAVEPAVQAQAWLFQGPGMGAEWSPTTAELSENQLQRGIPEYGGWGTNLGRW